MRNTLALVLMVFGIVGCASVLFTGNFIAEVSDEVDVLAMSYPEQYSLQDIESLKSSKDLEYEYLESRVVKNVNDLKTGEPWTFAEAMNLKTGKKFHIGNIPFGFQTKKYKYSAVELARLNCELLYQSECVISLKGGDGPTQIIYRNLEDYELRQAQNKRTKEINRQTKIATRKREEEETKRRKQNIIIGLTQRCEEYGFSGESNINACIQREAQHDKELALQRLELQRSYAQNVTEPVQEEEDLPFLVKFLGDVAIGVAENLADPAFQRDMQQQRQINELKANQKNDIFRNCRPNC